MSNPTQIGCERKRNAYPGSVNFSWECLFHNLRGYDSLSGNFLTDYRTTNGGEKLDFARFLNLIDVNRER
jgi:hypothetical protein